MEHPLTLVKHALCCLAIATLQAGFARPAQCQAVQIQVAETNGRPIENVRIEVLGHSSTTPLVFDTVRATNGTTLLALPTPRTNLKLYVIKICAANHAPQFVTAPFAQHDTLRISVHLAPLQSGAIASKSECDTPADENVRSNVLDSATFVGRAAKANLEVSALTQTYESLLRGQTKQDTARAKSFDLKTRARLLARLKSGAEKERAAHELLSYVFWTHSTLDSKARRSVRALLPASSKWWLTQPYLVGFWGTQLLCMPGLAGDLANLRSSNTARRCMQDFLQRMTDSTEEPELRSEAKSQMVRLAYLSDDTARAKSLLAEILSESPEYPLSQQVLSLYATDRPLRQGVSMPSFDFPSLPDTSVRIVNTNIAARFTLIDFWGTWCGPCVGAMAELHAVYSAYHDRNFEILSIAADDRPETVNAFRRTQWPMPWMNAFVEYMEGVKDNPRLQALGIVFFPRAVLVDPQGKILGEFGSDMQGLRGVLDAVLPRRGDK